MMTLPEAARSLGLAPATLRQQIKNGKLAARKVSRDWYITPEEVERYRIEHRRSGLNGLIDDFDAKRIEGFAITGEGNRITSVKVTP